MTLTHSRKPKRNERKRKETKGKEIVCADLTRGLVRKSEEEHRWRRMSSAPNRRWSIAAHPLSLGGKKKKVSIFQRPLDLVFVIFFVTHVPTTLFVDCQCILPAEYFPKACHDLLQFHLDNFKDPLMGTCPAWLRSIIWCELLLQVPFFLAATYAFVCSKNWIRLVSPLLHMPLAPFPCALTRTSLSVSPPSRKPALMYGIHTATTLVPILGSLWLNSDAKLSDVERLTLTGIYLPYLVMPLLLALKMLASKAPFGEDKSQNKNE